jgi:hypothetical protein
MTGTQPDAPSPEYYMLECFEPMDWDDSALLKAPPPIPGVPSWSLGRPFPAAIPEPVVIELLETHTDRMREMDNTDGLVMTRRLLHALGDAGVDNLDAYAAVLVHPTRGSRNTDYVIANVIGLVSAADLQASRVVGRTQGDLLDVDFEGVTIDSRKAGGLLMFRLAENTSAIVVHDRVRRHLLAAGFDMLSFVPPSEWLG